MKIYWPILLAVFSNVIYQICAKSTPAGIDPLASVVVTYLVGAAASLGLYFIMNKGGNLSEEYRHLNWAPFVLGLAIVGLEVGSIYMYKVGWKMNTGSLVQNALLCIMLVFVGWLLYKEDLSLTKVIGIVLCLAGLVCINR